MVLACAANTWLVLLLRFRSETKIPFSLVVLPKPSRVNERENKVLQDDPEPLEVTMAVLSGVCQLQ